MKKYTRMLRLVEIKHLVCTLCNVLCIATALSILVLSPARAQTITAKKIDVDFNNVSLKKALDYLQKNSNYNFVFSEEQVNAHQVTLKGKGMALNVILEKILDKPGLEYVLRDNKVIIRRKTSVPASTSGAPKSVPMRTMGGSTPQGRVKGRVLTVNDEPLSGVTVLVKEQPDLVTHTDAKGDYMMSVSEEAKTMVFRYIGYKSREMKIGQGDLNVVLEQEENELADIVVTGIFTRKAESFTGAASTFTQEQLRSVGNQNVLQSLKMLDPSFIQVENLQMGSNPNALPDLQIRGANSLPDVRGEYAGSPNMPLFILDGFETNLEKIYDLDMNRVASVTILKDAAAKAIYGSRAANGVVVVETKRPEMGKLRLSYTGDLNLTTPDLSSYMLTNAAEKLQVELDAGRYSNSSQYAEQRLKEQYNNIYSDVYRGVNTDWLAQPVRNAIGQKHTLSLEGGDVYLRYGADFTFNDIAGVMKESGRRNLSGNVFLSYRLSNFVFRNTLMVTGNNGYDSPYGAFSAYSRLNPYWTPYELNGTLKKVLGQFTPAGASTPSNFFNPLYDASLGTKNFSKYTDITNNFSTEWSLNKSLKIIGRLGYTQKIDSREDFYPANHTRFTEYAEADFFRRGQYSITDGKDGMIKTDLTLNYSKLINKHLFFFNAGWNLLETKREAHGMTAEGFLNDRVDNINFALQYLQNGRPSGSDALKRETGLLSALNYSYDERYLADLTFRRQGSSVFGANNRWGNFWSVGIGWNIHRESFMNQQKWLQQLKLRASTGYTGNQEFNPYQAMATYNYYTDSYYDNVVGAKLMGLANEDLKWQQTMDYNFGIDASIFNRVNLRFDYYISRTSNLLTDLGLPGSIGFNTIKENLGELQNTGIDAVMSVRAFNDQSTGSFLNIFLNVGMNRNKLLKISDGLSNLNDELEAERTSTKPFTRYQEGQSTTTLWAVPSLGIDPINGTEIFRKLNGETTYIWDANDQVSFGDTNPKVRGSFGFNAQYKGFGLNCGFTYRIGGQYYNQTLVDRVENVDIQYNVDRRVFTDTWKAPGDQVFFKRITARPNRTNPSSRFVQDFHELQLGSLNASYDFRNTALLKQVGMQRLRVTLFTNEIARISSVRAERGLDFPFARTYSCSVQATF
ncbi:SusC/RagA family TonB-linked outer membrane protein [Pedobacter frigoris]|uniref:SusC/RagA family TonB-linked outer membrane protein n=1 Tax=Pedobacter frigoris TaxID=2571272 RepID=A0A4U1CLC7_9SPHI|nr:SusC/RagA family TonB-linked outer membrane protein [Pedobacter frigoris]TKC08597.1 SusC/RagA family TonB-linked outer membrane protein [Pedobacter frigoris]